MATKVSERVPSLPKYLVTLDTEQRTKYKEKLKLMSNIDPYNVSSNFFTESMEMWPEVGFPDIVTYLLCTTSQYTKDQIKAYKSLEAYQYFVAGWVRCVFVGKATNDIKIVIGKVNHSQRLNETPLKPWIAAKNDGTILTAHCNCMAGLGEVCSHVGALLFAVEAGVGIVKMKTCTSVPCKWLMPTPVTNIPYQELRDIDFSSSKTKKRKLDTQISGLKEHDTADTCTLTPSTTTTSTSYVPPPAQVKKFFEHLHNSNTKPAILSLTPPYNKNYLPKTEIFNLPKPLTELYSDEFSFLGHQDMLAKSNELFENMSVSDQQSKSIEEATRSQSKSLVWFQMRAGRITASKFHRACHTNSASPSLSLIKDVCYGSKFTSNATTWGCSHEKQALDKYQQVMQDKHENFTIKDSGFVVSSDYPHLGASPDAISYCSCHDSGCVEVKCPFCIKESTITDAVKNGVKICLSKTADGTIRLDRKHQYFYQVQLQLAVTKLAFADFVVWTPSELHIERVQPDTSFITINLAKAKQLYVTAILPELLSKWHTRPKVVNVSPGQNLYCFCRVQLSESLILVCSNEACLFHKFHMKCCGLSRKPTSKAWLCPDCRRLKKISTTISRGQ